MTSTQELTTAPARRADVASGVPSFERPFWREMARVGTGAPTMSRAPRVLPPLLGIVLLGAGAGVAFFLIALGALTILDVAFGPSLIAVLKPLGL